MKSNNVFLDINVDQIQIKGYFYTILTIKELIRNFKKYKNKIRISITLRDFLKNFPSYCS